VFAQVDGLKSKGSDRDGNEQVAAARRATRPTQHQAGRAADESAPGHDRQHA